MRAFDAQLLRLKQALGVTADQEVAEVLGLTKAAFSDRKKRGSFPQDKLRGWAQRNPGLELDVDFVLTGESQRTVLLQKRLGALGTAASKAATLGLPLDSQKLVQSVLFGVELNDGGIVSTAIDNFLIERLNSALPTKGDPKP